MLFTTSTISLLAAIGLVSGAPTPSSDSSAASSSSIPSNDCITLWPEVLEDIWEGKTQHIVYNTLSDPQLGASDPNQGNDDMGATWNRSAWTSREYTYASFVIPADAQKCALWSSFPRSTFD
ncbi:hypothetical protein SBOR_0896 [Sclerotinia borealis F-4128]|uniref:Uncharacterized protein n=1 Tax=Sclerotinia borealis (strain F-4128) TaxID=1432307 RepID=W9CRE2_SCLBF|nr:hypothetical protein SBOR_0896 [Sclerotinia borealis F-4128]